MTVLFGGTAITMNRKADIIRDSVIEVSGGRIRSLRAEKGYQPASGIDAVDATGCLVLPGFINGHSHAGMTLLRGIGDDLPLHQWLSDRIFPLERKWGTEEFVYAGTRLATLEMIRSGTTTFNDMYYFEEHAARAAHESGLRAICGQTIVEISRVESASADVFKLFDDFRSAVSGYARVTASVAPHSIYGVSEPTWKKIVEYAKARDVLVHVHLAETREEDEACRREKGKSPTKVFEELGLWDCRVIAAHGVELSEEDIGILGKHRVPIAYNPESNLKLANRICPVVELRQAGCPVVFGTDSTASNNNLDLFQEADTGAKLQVLKYGVGRLTAEETVKCLTIEGARALGLEHEIGSLEVGKAADIICVDINKIHAQPLYNVYSHIVYSAAAADVKHLMVVGRVLMRDYIVLSLSESEVIGEARRWGERINPV